MGGLGARSKSGDGLQWNQADDGVLWDVLLGPMLRRLVAVEVQIRRGLRGPDVAWKPMWSGRNGLLLGTGCRKASRQLLRIESLVLQWGLPSHFTSTPLISMWVIEVEHLGVRVL